MIRSHKFQSMKRKVGLRVSITHLSFDAHNAATVWPMAADALGRVLEICKNWNTQRVFNIHRRSLYRTRSWRDTHRYRGCTIDTEFRPSQNPVHSAAMEPSQLPRPRVSTGCPAKCTPIHGCDTMPRKRHEESQTSICWTVTLRGQGVVNTKKGERRAG